MTASHAEPAGFNVIGHLSSSAGLGNTARIFIELLRTKGFGVAGFDVSPYENEERPNLEPGMLVEDVRDLPFDHNLVIVSLDRLPKLWLRHAKNLSQARFRNVGLIFWELAVIPPAWVPALRMFDAMLACSTFVQEALQRAVPEVPTLFAEHPLPKTTAPDVADRSRLRSFFGIPKESTAFCCVFDHRSGLARKNPIGTVRAWLLAFPSRSDVCLVVKSNGEPSSEDPEVADLLRHHGRDPRIVWLSNRLSPADLERLFGCCDVFVSLHRSEGLGLVPMEAMALGKLVIATGYSGTTTFMSAQNSMPVDYHLIEPSDQRLFLSRRFAGAGALWAEPDLEHAAQLMRSAADDRAGSDRLAAQAQLDIERRQRVAWDGVFLPELGRLLAGSTRHVLRGRLKRQMLAREILNPVLLGKTLRTAIRRIR